MLRAVARMITGKGNDAAAVQQQIDALKREGAEALAAVDALKIERAAAASYDEARDLDDKIARQLWVTQHCAAVLPQLELELGAVRAAEQAAALARHKAALLDCYPKLKRAILAAVEAQHQAISLREAACREIGEAAVVRNLPTIAYAGFLLKDLVAIWQAENDRVFADLARKPKPAAMPTPVRAALPAPKPPVAIAKEPAPRPKRVMRQDAFPTTEGQSLVVFIRSGAELDDGTIAVAGDQIALPSERARELVSRGAADYAPAAVSGDAS